MYVDVSKNVETEEVPITINIWCYYAVPLR